MENEAVKHNICSKEQWCRVLYMVLFAVVLYLVMMLVGVVVLAQLVFALLTGKPNESLTDFAGDLSRYVYRIVAFLTYSDDRRPFPFNSWEEEADFDDDEDEYMSSVEDMGDVGKAADDDANKPGN